MAKPQKKGKKNPLQRRARRDVRLSYRPLLQENKRMQRAAGSAYGALPGELEGIGANYTEEIGSIGDQLTEQLSGVADFLPSLGGPQSEVGAFEGAYGDAGEAALGSLASLAARNAGYGASALRSAGLEQRSAQDTLLQQRNQLLQNMPMEIRARVDELREQRLTNQLARSQMQGDEAFRRYLIDLVGGELHEGKKGKRGKGKKVK